jgi:hypothetical protein
MVLYKLLSEKKPFKKRMRKQASLIVWEFIDFPILAAQNDAAQIDQNKIEDESK